VGKNKGGLTFYTTFLSRDSRVCPEFLHFAVFPAKRASS
jgi:hypothetical protein